MFVFSLYSLKKRDIDAPGVSNLIEEDISAAVMCREEGISEINPIDVLEEDSSATESDDHSLAQSHVIEGLKWEFLQKPPITLDSIMMFLIDRSLKIDCCRIWRELQLRFLLRKWFRKLM